MTKQELDVMIRKMIDDFKAMTNELGMGNTGTEFRIIGELFSFGFLNGKLMHAFKNRDDKSETWEEFCELVGVNVAAMRHEHTIPELFKQEADPDFAHIFDEALVAVSDLNADVFAIETTSGQKSPLFEPLSAYIRDPQKEKQLARRAINILNEYDFSDVFESKVDFFRVIFEYLIKDYSADSGGKYAEYFSPIFVADIMAEMIVGNSDPKAVSVYDPTAGSGTLLMSVANKIGTDNCTVYSQDISQKSSTFLRINLMLNGLAHSLNNVIEGNTLENPVHREEDGSLKQFDFIVSNPPFKLDFSASLPMLEDDVFGRFFAGLPNVPKNKKSNMAIYPTFIQHVLASLKPNGKAAIVVPSGFVSASAKIEKTIRKLLVDERMLMGVVHMPSNIFATTGTSVSVIFIDKAGVDNPIFVDASNLGEKQKIDGEQRTMLSSEDVRLIVDTFTGRKAVDGFSALPGVSDMEKRGYSFQAGQYIKAVKVIREKDVSVELAELVPAMLETVRLQSENSAKVVESLETIQAQLVSEGFMAL